MSHPLSRIPLQTPKERAFWEVKLSSIIWNSLIPYLSYNNSISFKTISALLALTFLPMIVLFAQKVHLYGQPRVEEMLVNGNLLEKAPIGAYG